MDFKGKNILIVLHTGGLGGAERQGLGLSRILTKKYNCNVNVLLTFSGSTSNEFENFAKKCQVREILHFGSPYLISGNKISYKNFKKFIWSAKYLLRLRKGVAPYKPDIIIPFLNFPSKVSYFLYKMLPTVKFTFWHQLGLDSWSEDIFERIAAKNVPCVIANASNGVEMYKEKYNIKPEKFYILPQYISLDHKKMNKESLLVKYGIPKNAIVIGMIAHYRLEKYHELLLNVFEKLNAQHKEIHLVFLGNANLNSVANKKYHILLNQIQEKNLSSSVSLLSEANVEEILNVLDIGVLVSQIEGVPNAVMEYMLYGMPVVATRHPGCEELLRNSQFLINNDDQELYDALDRLVSTPNIRVNEGFNNLKRIKRYDMDSYVEKLKDIINDRIKS